MNLVTDETKFKQISVLGDAIASMSYVFPPASGQYKNRHLEISPSYYPFVISHIGFGGMVDDALIRQLNPSPSMRIATHNSSYKYLVIRMNIGLDIGMPPIMFYPKSIGSKIGSFFSFKKTVKSGYNQFDKKYSISFRKNKDWFLECLNFDLVNDILNLDFPKLSGAIFQFSKRHATFAIVPRTIGKDILKNIIKILEKIVINIENKKNLSN